MQALELIFKIGIIIISFGLLKTIVFSMTFLIFNLKQPNKVIDYSLKTVSYYFTTSLIALFTYEVLIKLNDIKEYLLLSFIAGFTLFLHMLGKVEQERMKFKFQIKIGNKQFISTTVPKKHEHFILGGSMLLFAVSLTYPNIFFYPFLFNLLEIIYEISELWLIGAIIGIIGFFFLISTIIKGIAFIGNLFQRK